MNALNILKEMLLTNESVMIKTSLLEAGKIKINIDNIIAQNKLPVKVDMSFDNGYAKYSPLF